MNLIVEELKEQGYDKSQIANALCDGELIGKMGWTQEEIEDAYNSLKQKKRERKMKTAFFETKDKALQALKDYVFMEFDGELDYCRRNGKDIYFVKTSGPVFLSHNQYGQTDYELKKWRGKYYWLCDPCKYNTGKHKLSMDHFDFNI